MNVPRPLRNDWNHPASEDRSAATLYLLGSDTKAREALQLVQSRFPSRIEGEEPLEAVYYDTFDWRLYRDESTLRAHFTEHTCHLTWETSQGVLKHRFRGTKPPEFARDLPAGSFRKDMRKVVSVRRLLPVARIQGQTQRLRLLDANSKTVIRARIERTGVVDEGGHGEVHGTQTGLTLVPVRGYGNAFEEARRILEIELGLRASHYGRLPSALAALGKKPADYSSKFHIMLDPGERADLAAKRILRRLLATMLVNEDGVRADLDSEFLHDFRVAVRRTRSCTGQIKGVFVPETLDKFRREFTWLSRLTGPTRDLDVYLLKMEKYRSGLPERVRGDLEPLNDFLIRRQQTEQARLASSLESQRYRALVRDWEEFLNDDRLPEDPPPNAARPIRHVASERIERCHRRVLKMGRALGPGSPATRLHRLRLECKKLRYLLEFFSSLYRPAGREALVKELKGLQDGLGDFNDLQVQQAALTDFARQMLEEGSGTGDSLLAMGRLVQQLEVRQERERARIAKRFVNFASAENRELMDRLLAAPSTRTGESQENRSRD